jgi:hypothetical protein
MKLLTRALIAGLLAVFVAAAVASAAAPTPGGSYSGKLRNANSAAPPKLTLKVAANGSSLKAVLDCGEEGTYTLKGVPIAADGSFSKTGKVAKVETTISGAFKSASKAKGTFGSIVCFVGDDAKFTVKT